MYFPLIVYTWTKNGAVQCFSKRKISIGEFNAIEKVLSSLPGGHPIMTGGEESAKGWISYEFGKKKKVAFWFRKRGGKDSFGRVFNNFIVVLLEGEPLGGRTLAEREILRKIDSINPDEVCKNQENAFLELNINVTKPTDINIEEPQKIEKKSPKVNKKRIFFVAVGGILIFSIFLLLHFRGIKHNETKTIPSPTPKAALSSTSTPTLRLSSNHRENLTETAYIRDAILKKFSKHYPNSDEEKWNLFVNIFTQAGLRKILKERYSLSLSEDVSLKNFTDSIKKDTIRLSKIEQLLNLIRKHSYVFRGPINPINIEYNKLKREEGLRELVLLLKESKDKWEKIIKETQEKNSLELGKKIFEKWKNVDFKFYIPKITKDKNTVIKSLEKYLDYSEFLRVYK